MKVDGEGRPRRTSHSGWVGQVTLLIPPGVVWRISSASEKSAQLAGTRPWLSANWRSPLTSGVSCCTHRKVTVWTHQSHNQLMFSNTVTTTAIWRWCPSVLVAVWPAGRLPMDMR